MVKSGDFAVVVVEGNKAVLLYVHINMRFIFIFIVFFPLLTAVSNRIMLLPRVHACVFI